MKLYIAVILIFTIKAQAASELTLKLPSDWFKLDSKILLKDRAIIYGKKNKADAQVIHQKSDINRVFKETQKDLTHQCNLHQKQFKGTMKVVKQKNVSYCYVANANSIFLVSDETKGKRQLHHFKFVNMSSKEIEDFANYMSVQ